MTIFSKKSPPPGHYVYAYLRESDSKTSQKGTPYYIGKGYGIRAWKKHGTRIKVPSLENIVIIKHSMSDSDAKLMEVSLIDHYGRIDLKTGILMNLTIGGEGTFGLSEEIRSKRRESQRKAWNDPETKNKKREATKKVWDDPEHRKCRSEKIKATWADSELRACHSEKIKATWADSELRAQQSARSKEYHSMPENCGKAREYANAYWAIPESRIKASKIVKDRYNDPAVRERASIASKKKWADVTPERMAEIVAKRANTLRAKKEALESSLHKDSGGVNV